MKYYLYRHIRLDTDEVFYIGIGTKINKEFYYNCKSEFGRAYNKHNRNKYWTNITNKTEYDVEILLESDNYEFIKNKEIEFIEIYGRKDLRKGTLVNLTIGGDGVTGLIFSEEHRQKLSENSKGRKIWCEGKKFTEEHINNLRISHLGIGNKNKGKKYDDIYGIDKSNNIKEKQSIIRKGKYKNELNNFYGKKHSEETKVKMGTAVLQFDVEGNFIERFISMTDAANTTNSFGSLIQKVCKGERKSHNGFVWKYENINNTRINSYKK